MAPVKARFLPMRNHAGKFTKAFITSAVGSPPKMKTHGVSVKGKRLRRRAVGEPRIGKKTSVVWHFFKSLPHENGISRAICLLCKVIFKNPGGSTTGMRGHLDRKHPGVVDRVLSAQKYPVGESSSSSTRTDMKPNIRRTNTPPPPPLSVENGAIGEIGETEIFEEDDHDGHHHSTSRQHILPGPPPEVYPITTDTEEITRSLVVYMASNLLPLHSVEDPSFKKMLYNLNSIYIMEASHQGQRENSIIPTVTSALNELYEEIKEDIQRELEDKLVSVSLELWMKTCFDIYLLTTVNYVTRDWTFESTFLGMRSLPGTTFLTSVATLNETVSTTLNAILDEFEVKLDNVVNVVFNSSPFKRGSETNIISLNAMPCFNAVLREGFDILNKCAIPLASCNILERTREVAKMCLPDYDQVKRHPGKLLESMCNFIPKVPSGSLPFKDATPEDINAFFKMTKPLNEVVDSLLEEQIIPASTLLPLIFGIRNFLDAQVEVEVEADLCKWGIDHRQNIADAICDSIYTSYNINIRATNIGDNILALCSFLDPRYKDLKFLTNDQRQSVYENVMELLYEHGKSRASTTGTTGSIISVRSENPDFSNLNGSTSSDPLNTTPTTPNNSFNSSSKLAALMTKIMGRKQMLPPTEENQEELRNYMREPTPLISIDPYVWWSYNFDKYPALSTIAKRYLCIRGIATPAKQIFTGLASEIHNSFSKIESQYLDKLLCLKRHHPHSSDQIALSDSQSHCHQIVIEEEMDMKTEDSLNVENDIKTELAAPHQMMEEGII